MRLTVYGAGYVGLVTAACFAEKGHRVAVMDIDDNKIAALLKGQIPIYEPFLTEKINAHAGSTLFFTTDMAKAVRDSDLHFISVGTPTDVNGQADLRFVKSLAKSFAEQVESDAIVITKSTVPVGTNRIVGDLIQSILLERQKNISVKMVSNPEFLKEGSAIQDFMHPDRVIVGAADPALFDVLYELYQDFVPRDHFITMDIVSAELTKYAANAFLATKISFMNQLSQIAEVAGADIEIIKQGMITDERIGRHFMNPGCGFGGSCFPKDCRALIETALNYEIDFSILTAVMSVNERQKQVVLDKIKQHFGSDLHGKTFAVLGVAFKPNTDDIREAASLVVIPGLVNSGAIVKAYDPVAGDNAKQYFSDNHSIEIGNDVASTLDGVDAVIILTEWSEFFALTPAAFKAFGVSVIVDGRNLFEPRAMQEAGLTYLSIGRGIKEY